MTATDSAASYIPAVDAALHHPPRGFSDRFAYGFTKLLRFFADTFFAKRYGHRAVVLETVAAVPGMVGATLTHLKCLRRMSDDNGWIRTLLEEAENERMHLMTFIKIAQPSLFERFVILTVQWFFYVGFFLLYLVSSKTAHRVVGYFEEEAVISYSHYLHELDEGRAENPPAPPIAIHYWKMPADAMLRDVIRVIQADEAHHRDVNHSLADELGGRPAGERAIAPLSPARGGPARTGLSRRAGETAREVGRGRTAALSSGLPTLETSRWRWPKLLHPRPLLP